MWVCPLRELGADQFEGWGQVKAEVGILCALRGHLSYLLGISTPVVRLGDCWLVEHGDQLWALSMQGKTNALSHESARRMLDTFSPGLVLTFGPAALIVGDHPLETWFSAKHCARLSVAANTESIALVDQLTSPVQSAGSGSCMEAELLVSAESFIANTPLIERLRREQLYSTVLLDMAGHGVARACVDARVAWRHFRWASDRANDTAVACFSWNVRTLAKRGEEVAQLIEEATHEYSVIA